MDGTPLALVNNGTVCYPHPDRLGTVQRITDAGQQVVWSARYEPFGQAVIASGIEYNPRFPGQYYDAETGLNYNHFRDYDAGVGRYVESDPIGLDGGINTYAYVGNNPIIYTDPNGYAATGSAIGGAFGGALGGRLGPGGSAIGRTVGSAVGSAVEDALCPPNDDNDCQHILEKIQDVMRELNRRYMHQCRDKKGQWESHVPAFEGKKRQLEKLIRLAESKGCPVPPNAYVWLETACPAPGTDRNTSPGY